MINRRSFLRLVRNRIAAGVLCSGMLTDALESEPLLENLFPPVEMLTYDHELDALTYTLGYRISHELMEDNYYGVGIGQQIQMIRKKIDKKMEEASDGL